VNDKCRADASNARSAFNETELGVKPAREELMLSQT